MNQDRNEDFGRLQFYQQVIVTLLVAPFQKCWCQMKDMDIIFPLIPLEWKQPQMATNIQTFQLKKVEPKYPSPLWSYSNLKSGLNL